MSYSYLSKESSPQILVQAKLLLGTKEIIGNVHSEVIMGWAKDLGLEKIYTSDEVAWCLDGETLVSTLDGYKFIKDIKQGLDYVFTNENEFHLVNKLLNRNKVLHKAHITGSLPLLVTSDHPFLIKKCVKYNKIKSLRVYNDELQWVKFDEIKKGDLLCKKKNNLLVNSFLDNKSTSFIQLLGTYTAEGTYRKRVKGDKINNIKSVTPNCTLHIGKHELNHIRDLILKSEITKYSIVERRTCYQIEIRDKEFVIISSEIGTKSDKHVPYFILNGSKKIKESFLKGYLDGDGSFNSTTNKGSASSVSKKLIIGIGKLLLDQNIFPTFREELREGKMIIENRVVSVKNRYIIQYTTNKNKRPQYLQDDNYYYLPIRKIERNFKEDLVYDLEVDSVSNFLANDIVVHNCGLFLAEICKRAGLVTNLTPKESLWALNWSKFGTKQPVAMLGDVLTFKRNGGGHVGLYVGEDDVCYHILGGNQSNMVNITRIEKSRLNSIRRTNWKLKQPINVRVIKLESNGIISKNES